MGRTRAPMSATVKHGGIRSTPRRFTLVESAGSQQQDDFLNLERERDREKYREGIVQTTHTSRSHS